MMNSKYTVVNESIATLGGHSFAFHLRIFGLVITKRIGLIALAMSMNTSISMAQWYRSSWGIIVTSCTNVSVSDTFGFAPGATSCIDDGSRGTINLGESEGPPFPPPSHPAAALDEDSCLGNGLSLDFHGTNGWEHMHGMFKLHYQWGNADSDLVIAWDTTSLKGNFDTLTLQDPFGGSIVYTNMLTNSSLRIISHSDASSLTDLEIIAGADPKPITGLIRVNRSTPDLFALSQNYPNPFNPSTIIGYQLPSASHVLLKVFNMLGEEIATLVDGMQAAGYKTAKFETGNLPSGVYMYRFTARQTNGGSPMGSFMDVKKMLLLR